MNEPDLCGAGVEPGEGETLMAILPFTGECLAILVDRDTATLARARAWHWLAGHVLALDPDDCFDDAVSLADLAAPGAGATPAWPGTDHRRASLCLETRRGVVPEEPQP